MFQPTCLGVPISFITQRGVSTLLAIKNPRSREHYDVMYSERDEETWWTTSLIAFDVPEEQQQEIARYEFDGVDDLGVDISRQENRRES